MSTLPLLLEAYKICDKEEPLTTEDYVRLIAIMKSAIKEFDLNSVMSQYKKTQSAAIKFHNNPLFGRLPFKVVKNPLFEPSNP